MVWEDQGLYFTLILNSIVMVVCIAVGYVLHKNPDNHRALRPRLPKSIMGSFYQFPKSLFTLNEDEVATSVGVEGAIYCLLLKFCAGFMLSCCLGSIVIVSICATDTYLNVFAVESDPNDCRGSWNAADCEDGPFCEWTNTTAMPATSVTNIYCTPKFREGLFDFSVQNITPEKWTMWLYSIACLLSAVQMLVFLHFLLIALKALFMKAYVQPVMVKDVFTEKTGSASAEAAAKLAASPAAVNYSMLAAVGARTVMVAGFFDPEDDLKTLQDSALVLDALKTSTLPFGLKREHRLKSEKEAADEKMKPEVKSKNADARQKEADEKIKVDPIAVFGSFIIPESVVAVREPPKKMMDLMAEEKGLLDKLTGDVAGEQLEEDPDQLPHQTGICTKVPLIPADEEEIERVRTDLRPLIAEVNDQKFVGTVIFTFDTPLHALEFVECFNEQHAGIVSSRQAIIVGAKSGVIWDNLSTSGAVATIRFVIMIIIVVILTFFWGIPVAFLGSLENLATLPGIGGPFATLVSFVPTTILGILTAYLPTIVITVFNILLPIMLRAFSRIGGVQSLGAEDSTVLTLFFFFTLMSGIIIQAAIQGGLGQLAALLGNPTQDAIFAFVMAIISPSGGYWFSFLITAGCMGTFLKLLLLGPVIVSKLFVKLKLVGHQEGYNAIFAPRKFDFPIFLAVHLFFFAIGMLFHSTVPFLVPFGLLYFCNAYLVERALLLDGGAPQAEHIIDFMVAKNFLGIVLTLHSVASFGTIVVSVAKLHVPAIVIGSLSFVVSLVMQYMMRSTLNPLVKPSVKLYHQLVASSPSASAAPYGDQVTIASAANAEEGESAVVDSSSNPATPVVEDRAVTNATSASAAEDFAIVESVPGIGPLEPWTINEGGYKPTYSFYAIDDEIIAKIKAKDYSIDKQWYHREGPDAEVIPWVTEEERAEAAEQRKKDGKEPIEKKKETAAVADDNKETSTTKVEVKDDKEEKIEIESKNENEDKKEDEAAPADDQN